ncbi:unnamed protein product [Ectocarpus sp. CCAP 1310/34]|nr:unnamed protein product [Ectocarpus sp. CCAP 1310/34]
MLRAQHCVLVEDLQRSESADVGEDDDPLRQASLLTAACWQLRDNGSSDAGNEQGTTAALELAAAVVAAGLTSASSDLSRRMMDTLRWEGQAPPLEGKLVGIASRVRWMYLVRLAVELGLCDLNEWEEALHLLAEPKKPIDLESLHETRQGIHALFHGFRGGDGPLLLGGVFPRSTESRGELVSLIERGHSRLARFNVLLRAIWSESAGTGRGSFEERTEALNTLVGVMLGESQLHPSFALKLFSALGLDVIRRAKSSPDKVPQSLQGEIANLGLSSGGVLSEASQRAALAVTKLAALVRISEVLSKSRDELSLDLAQRGAALQAELRVQVKAYAEHQQSQRREEVLSAAEDFIAEMPPEEAEHGPGNSQLDIMTHLLGAIITGTPSGKEARAQSGVPDAAMVGSNHSSEQALASPTDRRTPDPMKQDRHRLDARGNLLEIFAKIASAMPCDPDQYVASAWRTMQASRTLARMERPRGDEEVELEAFELAVDAQALETLRESLLGAIDRPERNLCDLPVSVNGEIEQPLSGGIRLITVPLSGLEVTHDDEMKALQRQAEAVRYKNAMNIVARTGLALQPPAEAGTPSLTAIVAAAKHAKRWKSAAQDDVSGLGRPELERLNSIMDMRITSLSDQLATLVRSKKVEPGTAKQTKADHEVVLSPDDWVKRERQRLNVRIRIRKEKLHGMETRLRHIRKGDKGRTGDVEAIWMSEDERLEMETNLFLISRKIAKANFLLRKMRSRWDIFRERHRHLAPLVHDRLTQSDTFKNGAPGARVITETSPRERSQRPSPTSSFVVDAQMKEWNINGSTVVIELFLRTVNGMGRASVQNAKSPG